MALSKNKDQEKEHEQNCSRNPSEEKKRREKSTGKWFWKCFQIRERNKREYG